MASCPKCRARLKLYQVSPYCPQCGVHVMYASFEGQFQKDRRMAEMTLANTRVNILKFKSAYLSGKPQKLRIAAVLLPLISLFLPLGSLSVSTPFYADSLRFSVLDLTYRGFFGDGLFAALAPLRGGAVYGDLARYLRLLMLAYTAFALCCVLILLLELLCFIGNRKVNVLLLVFSGLGCAAVVVSRVLAGRAVAAAALVGSTAQASVNPLFLVCILLFVPAIVCALWCLRVPPVRDFSEGDLLRVDYYKKLKKKQIQLMDIPTPIFESEEERAEREKLIKKVYQLETEGEEVKFDG